MASVTSGMTELTMRDQESDCDGDFDLDSDDLYTNVVYLNAVDDGQSTYQKGVRGSSLSQPLTN